MPRPTTAIAEISRSSRRCPPSTASARSRTRAATVPAAVATTRARPGSAPASSSAPPATQHAAENRQVGTRPCRTRNVRLPNSPSPRTSRKSLSRIRPTNPAYRPASRTRSPARTRPGSAEQPEQVRHGDVAGRQHEGRHRAPGGQPRRRHRVRRAQPQPACRDQHACPPERDRRAGGEHRGDRHDDAQVGRPGRAGDQRPGPRARQVHPVHVPVGEIVEDDGEQQERGDRRQDRRRGPVGPTAGGAERRVRGQQDENGRPGEHQQHPRGHLLLAQELIPTMNSTTKPRPTSPITTMTALRTRPSTAHQARGGRGSREFTRRASPRTTTATCEEG